MNEKLKQTSKTQPAEQRIVNPHYDVVKADGAYQVNVYMPGVDRNDAVIALDKETLIVEGKRTKHWQDTWRDGHREILVSDYQLQLQLNVEIDEEAIEATSNDGVLTITLPVAKAAQPKMISIQ